MWLCYHAMKQPAAFSSARNISCTSSRAGVRNVAVRTAQVVSSAQEAMPDPEARNVAIFVEPSPFSHISGMKNRFECLIKNLTDQGDDVMVFTPDRAPPKEYFGAQVRSCECVCVPLASDDVSEVIRMVVPLGRLFGGCVPLASSSQQCSGAQGRPT